MQYFGFYHNVMKDKEKQRKGPKNLEELHFFFLCNLIAFLVRCQEVLKKSEESRSVSDKTDNPLSVVDMNSLMSMEVKLQSNLTEQNSKFIKVDVEYCILEWDQIVHCFIYSSDCPTFLLSILFSFSSFPRLLSIPFDFSGPRLFLPPLFIFGLT